MSTVHLSSTVRSSPIALLLSRDVPDAARRRDLLRIAPGTYASADDWRTLPIWERYLARVHAASLQYPDAVFCLESASALLGGPVLGNLTDVHVIAPPSRKTSRVLAGVRTHTTERREVLEAGGILLTTAADTAVDMARLRHNAIGLAVANAMLRANPQLTVELLRELSTARASSRGRRVAEWVFDHATPLTESTLEDLSLAVIEWLGFPEPELQHWFRGHTPEDDLRSDFWWTQFGVAGKADGDLKYADRPGSTVDTLQKRRARDAELRRRGARAVAHWAWEEVIAADPVAAALIAAGLRPQFPEDTRQLHSLRMLLTRTPRTR